MADRKDPFDIEGIAFYTAETTSAMNAKVRALLDEALETQQASCGCRLPIYLIAQTSSGLPEIQEWVVKSTSAGVSVVTYGGLISELWECFGDGRKLANSCHVRYACRKAMKSVIGRVPSLPALDLAEGMLDVSVASDDELVEEILSSDACSRGKRTSAEIVRKFEECLGKLGYIHSNRAADIIAQCLASAGESSLIVISEDPSENDASQRLFYKKIAKVSNIAVIRRNADDVSLAETASALTCSFATSLGRHAYAEAIVRCVENLLESGVESSDIAIVMARMSMGELPILEAMKEHGIAFDATLSMQVADTALGQWFMNVERFNENVEAARAREVLPYDDDELDSIVERICDSPYCLADDKEKFGEVLSGLARTGEHPEAGEQPFITLLLEDDKHELLSFVSDRQHPEGQESPQRTDDMAIAKSIGGMLKLYREFGHGYDVDDLANVAVRLGRSYGEPAKRCRFMERTDASYEHQPHIIFCDLDAASCSGFNAPSPFACLTDELGTTPDSWQKARLLRFQTLDILNHAKNGSVTFVRSAFDAAGNELPASPLYAELASPFGKMGDDGLPENASGFSISEVELVEGAIARGQANPAGQSTSVQGGQVSCDPASTFIKRHKDGESHRFSPTDLELYWCCPRKWFVSRNGVGYDEESEPSLWEPRTRGNIMHGTFEEYYRGYGRHHYRADLDKDEQAFDALDAAFRAAVDKAFDGASELLAESSSSPSGKYELEALFDMAKDVVGRDREFLPGFTPWLFEDYVESTVAGLRIGGIVDRIDMSDKRSIEGKRQVAIIDYKGSPDAEYEWGKKIEDGPGMRIQGLLYALLFEKKHPDMEVVGIIYRGYSNGLDKGMACVPLGFDKKASMSYEDFRQCLADFEQMFANEIAGLLAGDYPISPRNGKTAACRFCPVETACPGRAVM